jgi:putative oxidoreductase
LYFGATQHNGTSDFASLVPHVVSASAAILLVIGLWTPIAGVVIAIDESWTAVSHSANPWIFILLATLGASLAMIGPGAWSLDARLYGRKHIET